MLSPVFTPFMNHSPRALKKRTHLCSEYLTLCLSRTLPTNQLQNDGQRHYIKDIVRNESKSTTFKGLVICPNFNYQPGNESWSP